MWCVLAYLCVFGVLCVFCMPWGGPGLPWAARGGLDRLGAAWECLGLPFRTFGDCVLSITLRSFPFLSVPLCLCSSLCVLFRLLRVLCVPSSFVRVSGGLSHLFLLPFSRFCPLSIEAILSISIDLRTNFEGSLGLRTFDRSFNIRLVSMMHSSIFERSICFVSSFRAHLVST